MFSTLEKRADGSFRATGTTTVEKRPTGKTKIVGLGAVFYDPRNPGTEYQLSKSLVERIDPRAFDRCLASNEETIACFNHDMNWLLGRRTNGTLRLSKTSQGLVYEIDYNHRDDQHRTVMEKIERGDLTGASFWFLPLKETRIPTADGYIRLMLDYRLYEVGPVSLPAYPATTAGARGETPQRLSVREEYEAWKVSPEGVRHRLAQIHEAEAVEVRLRVLELDRA